MELPSPSSSLSSLPVTPVTKNAPTSSNAKSDKRKNYINWNDYFMATAFLSAKRSKDPVTQVGACIVDSDNRIVAIGYNGFPRNCSDDIFPWGKSDHKFDDKTMYVVHAEANAILNRNASTLHGTKLYTTLFPCNECAKLIVQSGIREIFYISDKYAAKAKYRASRRIFDAVGIKCTQYVPEQRKIIIDFDEIIAEDESPKKELNN